MTPPSPPPHTREPGPEGRTAADLPPPLLQVLAALGIVCLAAFHYLQHGDPAGWSERILLMALLGGYILGVQFVPWVRARALGLLQLCGCLLSLWMVANSVRLGFLGDGVLALLAGIVAVGMLFRDSLRLLLYWLWVTVAVAVGLQLSPGRPEVTTGTLVCSMLVLGLVSWAARRAQERSSAAVHELSLVARSVANGVAICDGQGRVRWINASLERMLGQPLHQVRERHLAELFGAEPAAAEAMEALRRSLQEGRVLQRLELPLPGQAAGARRWAVLDLTPVRQAGGKPRAHLLVAADATEARAHREALMEARRRAEEAALAKSRFLANMSHEIRTPMNGVLGMTDLLLATELDPEQRQCAELVRQSAGALLAVINDILDLSKIEAGELRLDDVPFAVDACLREAVGLLGPQAQARGLPVILHLDPAVPARVRGDPGRLRQVILNLVNNAIKFTEHGEIIVRATVEETRGPGVRIAFEVTDTGIGIPGDRQQEMFRPFIQGDASTTRRYGGSGLGLAICKQLVEAMGGSIGVQSRLGEGSRFFFSCRFEPCPDPADPAAADPPYPPGPAGPGPAPRADIPRDCRILVVEDHPVNQRVAVRMLEKLGYRSDVAENGRQALEALSRAPYDLVFMDCQMPEMDGFETTRELRRREVEGARAVVIAMTAHALKGDRERCLSAGMDDYVSKPVSFASFKSILDRYAAGKPGGAPGR